MNIIGCEKRKAQAVLYCLEQLPTDGKFRYKTFYKGLVWLLQQRKGSEEQLMADERVRMANQLTNWLQTD